MNWQPIETAPTDGTQVDLWCRPVRGLTTGSYARVPDCWFSVGRWWRNDDNGDDMMRSEVHNATHWMPRPSSPFSTRTK